MDAYNSSARTPRDYLGVAPSWRTELYDTCATPMTLDSYIDLVDAMGMFADNHCDTVPMLINLAVPQRNFTPELKTPPAQVPMPFNGYTQQQYAQDMVDTFSRKYVKP